MLEMPYPFALADDEAQASRQEDYGMNVDVVPVADPNATTMAQQIIQMQAITQLMQQNPGIYNQKAVHRQMVMTLGSDQADLFIPPDTEIEPLDPITENMNLLNMKPVKAGPGQNHEAHIAVHMAAMQDPSMQSMMANNPTAPAIMAAAAAHVQEHLAFQYRQQIEEKLGVPLPPPGEPLPEDVEYELAQLTADAADKLLNDNKAKAAQQQAEQAMEDPIVQQQMRENEIKERAVEVKREIADAQIADKAEERRMKAAITIFKEMSETERSTLVAQLQMQTRADDRVLKQAELAASIRNSDMSTAVNVLSNASKVKRT
jgi:hypothetical protein